MVHTGAEIFISLVCNLNHWYDRHYSDLRYADSRIATLCVLVSSEMHTLYEMREHSDKAKKIYMRVKMSPILLLVTES